MHDDTRNRVIGYSVAVLAIAVSSWLIGLATDSLFGDEGAALAQVVREGLPLLPAFVFVAVLVGRVWLRDDAGRAWLAGVQGAGMAAVMILVVVLGGLVVGLGAKTAAIWALVTMLLIGVLALRDAVG